MLASSLVQGQPTCVLQLVISQLARPPPEPRPAYSLWAPQAMMQPYSPCCLPQRSCLAVSQLHPIHPSVQVVCPTSRSKRYALCYPHTVYQGNCCSEWAEQLQLVFQVPEQNAEGDHSGKADLHLGAGAEVAVVPTVELLPASAAGCSPHKVSETQTSTLKPVASLTQLTAVSPCKAVCTFTVQWVILLNHWACRQLQETLSGTEQGCILPVITTCHMSCIQTTTSRFRPGLC